MCLLCKLIWKYTYQINRRAEWILLHSISSMSYWSLWSYKIQGQMQVISFLLYFSIFILVIECYNCIVNDNCHHSLIGNLWIGRKDYITNMIINITDTSFTLLNMSDTLSEHWVLYKCCIITMITKNVYKSFVFGRYNDFL